MSRPIRILIVDDDSNVCDLLALTFGLDHRFDVVGTAGHGLHALDLIEGSRPDVVILDVRLPGLSGLAVIEAIRSAAWPVRVIAYAGDEAELREAARLGADETLLKGNSLRNLIESAATAGVNSLETV